MMISPEWLRVFHVLGVLGFVVISSVGFAVFHYYWHLKKNNKGNFWQE